jgi:hypothetical protein
MYEAQIAKGMALLNAKRPAWRKKVNPDTLDMLDPSDCVLGQVTGDYFSSKACELLGWEDVGINVYSPTLEAYNKRAGEFGFAPPDGGMDENSISWDRLRDEWLSVLDA